MSSDERQSVAELSNACFLGNKAGQQNQDTDSYFLPPERDGLAELKIQRELLFKDPISRIMFDGFPDGGFILNAKRQVVAVNHAVIERFPSLGEESLLGHRPGEAFGCIHSRDTEYGCGTTRFCRYCGAAQVLFKVRMGQSAQEQCHIITEVEREALDLLVWGTPFSCGGQDFILFAVADISHEKRRQALERVFFTMCLTR